MPGSKSDYMVSKYVIVSSARALVSAPCGLSSDVGRKIEPQFVKSFEDAQRERTIYHLVFYVESQLLSITIPQ